MTLKVIPTRLPGVLVIEPDVLGDERGFFMEAYHEEKYRAAGIDCMFVQDNHSFSMNWHSARPALSASLSAGQAGVGGYGCCP